MDTGVDIDLEVDVGRHVGSSKGVSKFNGIEAVVVLTLNILAGLPSSRTKSANRLPYTITIIVTIVRNEAV